MLKKYKPICPIVSSKDFQLIQDVSIVDKEGSQESKQTESVTTRQTKTQKRKIERPMVFRVIENKSKEEEDEGEENEAEQTEPEVDVGSEAEDIENDEEEKETEEELEPKKKKAAWVDEDDGITLKDAMQSRTFKKNRRMKIDNNEKYSDYLKKKFTSRYPRPAWADPKSELEAAESDDEDLTKQAGGFVRSSKKNSLAATYLSFNRLTDINKETRGQEGREVTAVEFHPHLQVALVAGQTGVLSLFQVTGGADNPKLAQIKADKFPIKVSHFCGDTQVLAGSDKSNDLFIYNMETGEATKSRVRYQENIKNFRMSPDSKQFAVCGENGSIRLYTSRTKEFVQQMKMNCYVNDVVYAPNGNTLYSCGGTGEIYEWDLRSPLPVQTFTDDGCIKGTRLAISPDGQLLAAGSSSGVVNIYDLPISTPRPAPNKTLLHLTTSITYLTFNATSDILAFSSLDKNGAVKLYNLRSRCVFNNFPDPRMSQWLCRPNVVDFSPGGGYMAVSNNDRSAFLFRLHHYEKY